jgi:signal transduction histidine kinase
MIKNIKTKLLVWYSLIIVFILSIFSFIVINEFTRLVMLKEQHIKTSITHLENILLIWIPVLIIISIIVGYFIIKKSLCPVKQTIKDVNQIQEQEFEKRLISHTKNDEIEELVNTFNNILDKLNISYSKIKRFSNDASHELKTPLTVIRGIVELGLRKDRTKDEYKKILNNTLNQTIALQELVDSLLFLSSTNKKEIEATFKTIEIDEIIINIISQNRLLMQEKNIQIKFINFENIKIKAHPLLVQMMISNIIQNAIKYSHKDSIIEISLNKSSLTIKDYGIGIKENEIKNIFDRFYRVEQSRTNKGYGLGLSIVKLIANIHNFKIEVQSKYNKYSIFTINFY